MSSIGKKKEKGERRGGEVVEVLRRLKPTRVPGSPYNMLGNYTMCFYQVPGHAIELHPAKKIPGYLMGIPATFLSVLLRRVLP